MWQLNKIVVSQIVAFWKDVAYSLRYGIPIVDAIKVKHKDDPKSCCQELLEDWLSTEHGMRPKSWETLLRQLKEVSELAASVEHITEQL